jgi:hypothetical protein
MGSMSDNDGHPSILYHYTTPGGQLGIIKGTSWPCGAQR